MEIERKFLIDKVPFNINELEKHIISQCYICTDPVLRIRRLDDEYILTVKSNGRMERIEIEKLLTKQEYEELLTMAHGNVIEKKRYIIPLAEYGYPDLKVELDIFSGLFKGLIIAEVEFPDKEKASSFRAPDFLSRDVTMDDRFFNSTLSTMKPNDIENLINSLQ